MAGSEWIASNEWTADGCDLVEKAVLTFPSLPVYEEYSEWFSPLQWAGWGIRAKCFESVPHFTHVAADSLVYSAPFRLSWCIYFRHQKDWTAHVWQEKGSLGQNVSEIFHFGLHRSTVVQENAKIKHRFIWAIFVLQIAQESSNKVCLQYTQI